MQDYDKLLDDAYSNLPDKAKQHESRFEIPQLQIVMQSNKTIIKDFTQICEKIRREPRSVTKFLSRELAAPASVQANALWIYGKFNSRKVIEKFNKYVKKYVLCATCGKPDTHIIEQDKVKILVCEACGARTPIR